MEQQLKQRLVGVAVIFSLAVIFLPMLLDGSGSRPDHLTISIPTPPDIASYEIVEERVIQLKKKAEKLPDIVPVIVDEISDPPESAKDEPKVISSIEQKKQPVPVEIKKAITKPEVKSKPEPRPVIKPLVVKKEPVKKPVGGQSWVIQVGSFSDKNKAYRQRDKLRKAGLGEVFIEKFKYDGKLSYRVRMGPFIEKKKARVTGNKIRAKYNIKGLVMHYDK